MEVRTDESLMLGCASGCGFYPLGHDLTHAAHPHSPKSMCIHAHPHTGGLGLGMLAWTFVVSYIYVNSTIPVHTLVGWVGCRCDVHLCIYMYVSRSAVTPLLQRRGNPLRRHPTGLYVFKLLYVVPCLVTLYLITCALPCTYRTWLMDQMVQTAVSSQTLGGRGEA